MGSHIGFLSSLFASDRTEDLQQKATLVTALRDKVATIHNLLLKSDSLTLAYKRMDGEITMSNEEYLAGRAHYSELLARGALSLPKLDTEYLENVFDLNISEDQYLTAYWEEMPERCSTDTLKTAVKNMDKCLTSIEANIKVLERQKWEKMGFIKKNQ